MGLSSNARLLTITSRLTSNEYESQQVSNAKMRLAVQSQSASEEYIAALNSEQLTFVSFNSDGGVTDTKLTPSVIYQYGDSKNQYVITNAAKQLLLSNIDCKNFRESNNLEDFLKKYGLNREYKTKTLEDAHNKMKDKYAGYKAWKQDIDNYMKDANVITNWKNQKNSDYETYLTRLDEYNSYIDIENSGISMNTKVVVGQKPKLDEFGNEEKDSDGKVIMEDVTSTYKELKQEALEALTTARQEYEKSLTLENFAKNNIPETDDKKAYDVARAEYEAEIENLGIEYEDAYVYNDSAQAQWYTNLWYRLNGESSEKSLDGKSEANFQMLPQNLLTSDSWLRDAVTQGIVSIEKANYVNSANMVPDWDYPDVVKLRGITWESKIYSSCSDISKREDSEAKVLAEAEYKRKTNEINAKDEKYQRKINLLDSEHTALQTEYESVKSAMDKNIDRSFKAFQG